MLSRCFFVNPFPRPYIDCFGWRSYPKSFYPGGIDLNQRRPTPEGLGSLPNPAPLAMAYVPMQASVSPSYEAGESLSRGTLFPGLDLPFMNLINDELPATPLTELMAIDFVADELELYLDTHPEDGEAFALYQTMLALQQEARERYVRTCGPIRQSDMLSAERYTWLDSPWPWEYRAGKEG